MAIQRRTWILLLVVVVLMLLYFIFIYLGTLTDMKYGAIDRLIMSDHSEASRDVVNAVYSYVNSFSIFILVQFAVIFYLLFKIERK